MVFQPIRLQVDHSAYEVIDTKNPVFSWGAEHDETGRRQTACRVTVTCADDGEVWDSGWVKTGAMQIRYAGWPLKSCLEYGWTVRLRDDAGRESGEAEGWFLTGLYEPWSAPWIAAEDRPGVAPYFRREFTAEGVERAVLLCCGIGYQLVTINGEEAGDGVLAPLFTDYTKTCCYTVTDVTDFLTDGANCLGVVLGEGWRRNCGQFLTNNIIEGAARFFGRPQLTAILRLFRADGSYEDIVTDERWECGFGAYTANNLFDGETFDMRLIPWGFDEAGFGGGWGHASVVNAPGVDGDWHPAGYEVRGSGAYDGEAHTPCVLRPQTVTPIRVKERYAPVSVYSPRPGVRIVDFGQNIAGRVRLWIPECPAGTTITVVHAEELGEDGGLHTANLRGAKCTDVFIADKYDGELEWAPDFVYHGFRYVSVEGFPGVLDGNAIAAEAFYTDIDSGSTFTCGSAGVNAFHQLCVMTERANLHGIATDCPQRDERMGWMNDATVRFEETPYNFDIGRLFPKIVRDIMDAQQSDGSITCTAPFVYGGRPADPVCSSFLVAGAMAHLFGGDEAIVAEAYDAFAGWARNLEHNSKDGLVAYTYYGDWAGPADACLSMEDPHSAGVDGLIMSSGYLLFNCKTLAAFADTLGKTDDAAMWREKAEALRGRMLARWYHPETCLFDTGAQGCQAFALWLGLLPEGDRQRAADALHARLAADGMRLTTGNLNSRYIFDALTEYGYADDALALLERQEYPGWGYMLQHAATTVWERFELKLDGGMNSHSHPMFGSADRWLYSHLAGIRPAAPGWERVRVAPCFPTGLQYAEATVATCRGDVHVRWHRKYGKLYVDVSVPFNTDAEVVLPDGTHTVSGGYRLFVLD